MSFLSAVSGVKGHWSAVWQNLHVSMFMAGSKALWILHSNPFARRVLQIPQNEPSFSFWVAVPLTR